MIYNIGYCLTLETISEFFSTNKINHGLAVDNYLRDNTATIFITQG